MSETLKAISLFSGRRRNGCRRFAQDLILRLELKSTRIVVLPSLGQNIKRENKYPCIRG